MVKIHKPPVFVLPAKYDDLSPHERKLVREQYIIKQAGNCMFCYENIYKAPPSLISSKPINLTLFTKGFFNHPIHLQHNHNTGMTEGAVHAYCNAVLWHYHGR